MPADLDAVHHGKHEVEENKIDVVTLENGEALTPVGGRNNAVASPFEQNRNHLGDGRVIVNRKDPRGCAHAVILPETSNSENFFSRECLKRRAR